MVIGHQDAGSLPVVDNEVTSILRRLLGGQGVRYRT